MKQITCTSMKNLKAKEQHKFVFKSMHSNICSIGYRMRKEKYFNNMYRMECR